MDSFMSCSSLQNTIYFPVLFFMLSSKVSSKLLAISKVFSNFSNLENNLSFSFSSVICSIFFLYSFNTKCDFTRIYFEGFNTTSPVLSPLKASILVSSYTILSAKYSSIIFLVSVLSGVAVIPITSASVLLSSKVSNSLFHTSPPTRWNSSATIISTFAFRLLNRFNP